ncbi:hypothetical protein HDU87_000062 [Geranomyces variabilis]|uniref:Uncharacterized protein n=1 Tax=Geranomyces variabilis TaxID=109894 RepID=A0AAD5XUZ3_9FUNG|nr:hypothetical protein HDU87_000062 [Geranomyces variabilis]
MRPRVETVEDEFDRLSLVSRDTTSKAGGAASLKNRDVQSRFYAFILEQYDRLREIPVAQRKTGHFDSVLNVVSKGKLREGVISSGSYESFAAAIYEQSVDVSLASRNFAELLKALVGLTNTIYPALESLSSTDGVSSSPAPPMRRPEFSAYKLLYLICYARPPGARHGNAREVIRTYAAFPAWVQDSRHVRYAMQVLKALRADLDFVALNVLWDQSSTSQRAFLEERTLQILAKAYFTIPMDQLLLWLRSDGETGSSEGTKVDKLLRAQVLPDSLEDRIVDGTITLRKAKIR